MSLCVCVCVCVCVRVYVFVCWGYVCVGALVCEAFWWWMCEAFGGGGDGACLVYIIIFVTFIVSEVPNGSGLIFRFFLVVLVPSLTGHTLRTW